MVYFMDNPSKIWCFFWNTRILGHHHFFFTHKAKLVDPQKDPTFNLRWNQRHVYLPSPIFHARWSWILWWLAGIVLGTGSTTSDCLINLEFTYLSYVVIYCSSRPICIMARVVLWGLHAQQRSMMNMWDVSTCQTAVNDHLDWRK